jgi:hypothetical protein
MPRFRRALGAKRLLELHTVCARMVLLAHKSSAEKLASSILEMQSRLADPEQDLVRLPCTVLDDHARGLHHSLSLLRLSIE